MKHPWFLLLAAISFCLLAVGQQASPSASNHYDGVDARGDKAMGFSHELTSHHFLLFRDGGAIEIQANNPNDSASRQAIREHLIMIARMFSQGDFELPMFIHATQPPGIETMKRLKAEITYRAENTLAGAEVRITTKDPQAVKAVHDFLRFQILDHRTKDLLEIAR